MNPIGILTFETVPRLNRHLRNAFTAAWSKHVACAYSHFSFRYETGIGIDGQDYYTSAFLPRARASYGYSGLGAYIASAFALEAFSSSSAATPLCVAAGRSRSIRRILQVSVRIFSKA